MSLLPEGALAPEGNKLLTFPEGNKLYISDKNHDIQFIMRSSLDAYFDVIYRKTT